MNITAEIKIRAAELGFDRCGFAVAGRVDADDRLGEWLHSGMHADMGWFQRNKDVRRDVRLWLEGARSVVVVARNYYSPRPAAEPGTGRVSCYAWGEDYHRVLRQPLNALASAIEGMADGVETVMSIDSGPALEKFWAARAGIGWVGRNTLIIAPGLGSWMFLGLIATTLELEPDAPMESRCGECRKCVAACPTCAITDRGVDARRCLSYQTVENRGEIPEALHQALGLRVFGCDTCQEVCPHNAGAVMTSEARFAARPGQANPNLRELSSITDDEFAERFAGTVILRAKSAGMRRNARVAGKNSE